MYNGMKALLFTGSIPRGVIVRILHRNDELKRKGGGMSYFPLFFDIKNYNVLITGAGPVAQRRIRALSESGAAVTVVAREVGGQAEELFRKLSENGFVNLYRMDYREYRERYPLAEKAGPAGEGGWFLVLAATGDPEADRLAALDGRRAGAFVNVAGKKEMSDFYFPGLAKQGPVVAGVTAGGTDHRLAKRMTEAVQKCLVREMTRGEIER